MTEEPSGLLLGVARAPALIVGVDFDGTLSPIVDHPQDARPLPGAVDALAALAALPDTWVAVISGRALDDLNARLAVPPEVVRVGSHGLETSGPTVALSGEQASAMTELRSRLAALGAEVPGLAMEPKPWSVAVHYRHIDHERDLARVLDVTASLADGRSVWSKQGKEVVELFVAEASKAHTVAMLRAAHPHAAVVYLGDDVTDEEVFRALGPDDVGVKVGPGATAAAVRTADPAAALAWLVELCVERARRVEHC
ncbi:MAG: HAD-superfamily hydrolase, subfamily [Acidimicrobiia bacterium]|nr:HAD-superfamily hydrolase, subfamily [Acidimicrobiia bacterium]